MEVDEVVADAVVFEGAVVLEEAVVVVGEDEREG